MRLVAATACPSFIAGANDIGDLIARRTGNFLAAIEQELAIEASLPQRNKSKKRVRIGLTAFESEHWPSVSTREDR